MNTTYHAPPPRPRPYGQPPLPAQPVGERRAANPSVRAFVTVFGIVFLVTFIAWFSVGSAVSAPQWARSELDGSAPLDGVREVVVETQRVNVSVGEATGDQLSWSGELAVNPENLEGDALRRSGDQLILSPETPREFGIIPRVSWGWGWGSGRIGDLTVEAPSGPLLDLTLNTGIGRVDVQGQWNQLTLNAGVGEIVLGGTSKSVDVNAGVGEITGTVTVDGGPLTIDGGVGAIELILEGSAPSRVDIDGGVGDIWVALPPTTLGYVVDVETGIGAFSNRVPAPDPNGIPVDAPVEIEVDAGIGSITLVPAE